MSDVELNRHAKVLLESNGIQIGQVREELRNPAIAANDRATENQKWFDHLFIDHRMWQHWMGWENHCKILQAEAEAEAEAEADYQLIVLSFGMTSNASTIRSSFSSNGIV